MFAYDFSMMSLESVTTTVERRNEGPRPTEIRESEPRPSFKRISAMSAATLEEFLGLPRGAWKKRRLFALRTMTDAHSEAGIPKGSQIVVEPGARTAPGRLVLVKENDGLTVRRIDYDQKGRTVMRPAGPGMLPFPSEGTRKQVMGTIIGVLPRARVAGRSITSGRRPATNPMPTPLRREKAVAEADHQKAAVILRRNMEVWSQTAGALARTADRAAQARWQTLAGRLRVLASCLEVAHQKTLYGALAEEANRIIVAMKRELDRHRTPGWGELELLPRPPACPPTRTSDTAVAQTDPTPNAAKQHCADSISAGLDTGMTAMV